MSVGEAPLPASMFGRVQPSPASVALIAATVPEAPSLAPMVEPPRRTLPLWRYRHPRYRGQLIGCCVGESIASLCETTYRTPYGLDVSDTDPAHARPMGGTPAFSPLAVYWDARDYSRSQGRPIRGEGAIVTDALSAVMERGLVLYDAWPSTEANYRGYSDSRPPASFRNAKRIKVEGECRRITSERQLREYLGAGYTVVWGGPWRGGSRTKVGGAFAWNNPSMGGHAVELSQLDLDADAGRGRVYINNSWDNAGWGVQTTDPMDPHGFGYCPYDQFRLDLLPEDFEGGAVEVVVICEVAVPPAPDPTPVPTPNPVPTPGGLPVTISVPGYGPAVVVLPKLP